MEISLDDIFRAQFPKKNWMQLATDAMFEILEKNSIFHKGIKEQWIFL